MWAISVPAQVRQATIVPVEIPITQVVRFTFRQTTITTATTDTTALPVTAIIATTILIITIIIRPTVTTAPSLIQVAAAAIQVDLAVHVVEAAEAALIEAVVDN